MIFLLLNLRSNVSAQSLISVLMTYNSRMKPGAYSLSKANVAAVQYPTFSGSPDEDFVKFKKDIKDAYKSNQVQREDQLKKLRECLDSQVKFIITESTRNMPLHTLTLV